MELRDKLVSGEIDIDFAKAQYWNDFKEGQRSWHSKDWKERRSKFIKDKCEICTSKETLTLQHLSHPRKYSEYARDITKQYTTEYMNTNPVIDKSEFGDYVRKNYEYVPISLCPNCKSRSLNKRKRKLPQYRCIDCRHEFDEAVYRSMDELISTFHEDQDAIEVRDKCFVSKEWRTANNLSNVRYWLGRERAKIKDSKVIENEAFLLFINDSIKYLSFEDTITACRRCAFNFDIKNMELCPKCKVYYKGIQYQTCIQCLPEEKRKIALENIELGKGWQAMHEELGID
jgi:predicted Zn-ribbon and HTH transcriptional regulator